MSRLRLFPIIDDPQEPEAQVAIAFNTVSVGENLEEWPEDGYTHHPAITTNLKQRRHRLFWQRLKNRIRATAAHSMTFVSMLLGLKGGWKALWTGYVAVVLPLCALIITVIGMMVFFTLPSLQKSIDNNMLRWEGAMDTALLQNGFAIKRVLITGYVRINRQILKEKLAPYFKKSLIFADINTIAKLIAEDSLIYSVSVRRSLPDTLYIYLKERTPIGIIATPTGLAPIDADGVVLRSLRLPDSTPELTQKALDALGIPRLIIRTTPEENVAKQNAAKQDTTGYNSLENTSQEDGNVSAGGLLNGFKDLHKAIEATPVIRDRLRGMVQVTDGRWNLLLDNGITLLLPADSTEAAKALGKVRSLQDRHMILDRAITHIDLRDTNKIFVGIAGDAKTVFDSAVNAATGKDTENASGTTGKSI